MSPCPHIPLPRRSTTGGTALRPTGLPGFITSVERPKRWQRGMPLPIALQPHPASAASAALLRRLLAGPCHAFPPLVLGPNGVRRQRQSRTQGPPGHLAGPSDAWLTCEGLPLIDRQRRGYRCAHAELQDDGCMQIGGGRWAIQRREGEPCLLLQHQPRRRWRKQWYTSFVTGESGCSAGIFVRSQVQHVTHWRWLRRGFLEATRTPMRNLVFWRADNNSWDLAISVGAPPPRWPRVPGGHDQARAQPLIDDEPFAEPLAMRQCLTASQLDARP
jgi:hypothetical protein